MDSSAQSVRHCPALTLENVVLLVKERTMFSSCGTAIMTPDGTTHLTQLVFQHALMITLWLGCSAVVSRSTASTWPNVAHLRKQDGPNVNGQTGLSSMALEQLE